MLANLLGDGMKIVPMTRDDAFAFVRTIHRHNKIPPASHKFSLGLLEDAPWDRRIVGVCVAGRPIARSLDVSLKVRLASERFDDEFTIELTRVCTDGTPNACTMLIGAARRAAVAMGYTRVITYTQHAEGGASMRAAGMRLVAELAPRGDMAACSTKRKRKDNGTGDVARVRWQWP